MITDHMRKKSPVPLEEKRRIIGYAYPGERWKERVKKMSDKQVHSTYMRLLNNGQLKGIK